MYCALLKAALVGPDGVEEKYLDSDSPPPPVWLKYLRRDGHSVWPELLRRWVLNGPCARHYTEMELDLGAQQLGGSLPLPPLRGPMILAVPR